MPVVSSKRCLKLNCPHRNFWPASHYYQISVQISLADRTLILPEPWVLTTEVPHAARLFLLEHHQTEGSMAGRQYSAFLNKRTLSIVTLPVSPVCLGHQCHCISLILGNTQSMGGEGGWCTVALLNKTVSTAETPDQRRSRHAEVNHHVSSGPRCCEHGASRFIRNTKKGSGSPSAERCSWIWGCSFGEQIH